MEKKVKMIKKITMLSLMLFASMISLNKLVGQVTIVNYDFNSGTTYATQSPTLASNITCTVNSTETFTTFAGIASSGAFTSNSTGGQAIAMSNSSGTNTKYFEFGMAGSALVNYSTFKIYFQAQRSNTGAQLVTIQYKLNNGSYTTFASNTMAPGNGSFNAATINLPAAVDNPVTSLSFRLLASNASTTGTLRIDNFQVQGVPSAAISIGNNGSQPAASLVNTGSTQNILQTFTVNEGNVAASTLNQVTIPLSGNYIGLTDITASGLHLYTNTSNVFGSASLISSKSSTAVGVGESLVFNGLSQAIAKNSTRYFWVTADVASGALAGNTINAGALNASNFVFASASVTAAVSAGGVKTFTTIPTTQLSTGFCGYTSTSNTEFIWADTLGLPSTTSNDRYRFKLVSGATTLTWTTNNQWPILQFYLVPGVLNSTTYTTSVAWSSDNGATFGSYGPTCLLTSPGAPTTQLSAGSCGSSPSAYSQILFADAVANATQYEYQLINTSLSYTQTFVKTNNNFNLTQFTGLVNGTTYSVTVRAFVNNAWGPYGSSCNVTTPSSLPTTSLSVSNCGITASAYTQILFADAVSGATQYEYKLDNTALGYSQSFVKTNNNFNLTQFTGLVNNTTYSVTVRVKLNNTWGAYGAACNITTPSGSPTTALQPAYCSFTAPSFSTIIFATAVTGATQYEYLLTNASLGYSQSYVKPQANFNLTQFTGLALSTTYTVQVRVFFNNAWGAYGSNCTVVTPSSAMPLIAYTPPSAREINGTDNAKALTNAFDVILYPNPYKDEFTVNLTSYNVNDAVIVSVFDATGKLVENYTTSPASLNAMKLGVNYTAGIYNLVISQSGQTKNIKIIKQ